MRGIVLANFIIIIVAFVVMGVGLLTAMTVINTLSADESFNETVDMTYIDQAEGALGVFNYGSAIIIVGLILSTAIAAFFIRTHPIFAVGSIIVMIFVIMIAAVLANVYGEYSESDYMSEAAEDFGIMTYIFQNFPLFFLVGCVLVMIMLYAKPGGGQS